LIVIRSFIQLLPSHLVPCDVITVFIPVDLVIYLCYLYLYPTRFPPSHCCCCCCVVVTDLVVVVVVVVCCCYFVLYIIVWCYWCCCYTRYYPILLPGCPTLCAYPSRKSTLFVLFDLHNPTLRPHTTRFAAPHTPLPLPLAFSLTAPVDIAFCHVGCRLRLPGHVYTRLVVALTFYTVRLVAFGCVYLPLCVPRGSYVTPYYLWFVTFVPLPLRLGAFTHCSICLHTLRLFTFEKEKKKKKKNIHVGPSSQYFGSVYSILPLLYLVLFYVILLFFFFFFFYSGSLGCLPGSHTLTFTPFTWYTLNTTFLCATWLTFSAPSCAARALAHAATTTYRCVGFALRERPGTVRSGSAFA